MQPGSVLIYVGASDTQVAWGNCDDPRPELIEGNAYVIDGIDVHNWHTKVRLKGHDGWFPSSAFKEVE